MIRPDEKLTLRMLHAWSTLEPSPEDAADKAKVITDLAAWCRSELEHIARNPSRWSESAQAIGLFLVILETGEKPETG